MSKPNRGRLSSFYAGFALSAMVVFAFDRRYLFMGACAMYFIWVGSSALDNYREDVSE